MENIPLGELRKGDIVVDSSANEEATVVRSMGPFKKDDTCLVDLVRNDGRAVYIIGGRAKVAPVRKRGKVEEDG